MIRTCRNGHELTADLLTKAGRCLICRRVSDARSQRTRRRGGEGTLYGNAWQRARYHSDPEWRALKLERNRETKRRKRSEYKLARKLGISAETARGMLDVR